MVDLYRLIEAVTRTIRMILHDRDLTEQEKDAKIEETVSNAVWMARLSGLSREEDED